MIKEIKGCDDTSGACIRCGRCRNGKPLEDDGKGEKLCPIYIVQLFKKIFSPADSHLSIRWLTERGIDRRKLGN